MSCAVVIPVGPGERRDWLADTIESAMHYLGEASPIILIDNANNPDVDHWGL